MGIYNSGSFLLRGYNLLFSIFCVYVSFFLLIKGLIVCVSWTRVFFLCLLSITLFFSSAHRPYFQHIFHRLPHSFFHYPTPSLTNFTNCVILSLKKLIGSLYVFFRAYVCWNPYAYWRPLWLRDNFVPGCIFEYGSKELEILFFIVVGAIISQSEALTSFLFLCFLYTHGISNGILLPCL